MKTQLFTTILFFSIITIISAQDSWVQKTNFGGKTRYSAVSFSIGTKGYMGMGSIDGSEGLKDFWEWDEKTNQWSSKSDFAGDARHDAVGFSIGNKAYYGTGAEQAGVKMYKDFWEWNQTTNTWSKKTDFPGIKRRIATGFSIGNKGYIVLGCDSSLKVYYQDFWEYNPDADTINGTPWVQKANFPGGARCDASSFVIGTKAYIGLGNNYKTYVNYKDFWEWDQSTNIWTSKSDFIGSPRYGSVGFSINSKGYVGLGSPVGYGSPGPKDLYEYDPILDKWNMKANFGGNARTGASSFTIDDLAYVGLGIDPSPSNSTTYNDFWEYSTQNISAINLKDLTNLIIYPNPTTNILHIHSPNQNNLIQIKDLNGREIYNQFHLSGNIDIVLRNDINKGIYFVSVLDEFNVVIKTEKIVVY